MFIAAGRMFLLFLFNKIRLIFELIVRDKLVVTWKFVDGYYTFRIPSIYLPYTFCDIYTINYFRINQEVVCLLLYK